MHLHLDFESRSPLDIKKAGGYAYAEHPDTEVLCLGVKAGDSPTKIWVPFNIPAIFPGQLKDSTLLDLIQRADVVLAHNAGGFERPMWAEHMVRRRGFPGIPIEKWDDTAARAAMCALPRKLEDVSKALGLSQEKDMDGYKLMLKMSKPKALTKAQRIRLGEELGMGEKEVQEHGKRILQALKVDPRAPEILAREYASYRAFFTYHFNERDFERLCWYCKQDVETEAGLDKELPPLPKSERRLWCLDQRINDRGFRGDIEALEHAEAVVLAHSEKLQAELRHITGGSVQTAKQVQKILDWIAAQDVDIDNLKKSSVKDALRDVDDDVVHRVLKIRQSLSMSSTSKLASLRNCACRDGRVRGTTLYHGAATGRWTGRLFQPHNLPRGDETIDPITVLDDCIRRRDLDWLETFWGDPMTVVSSCLRGLLISDKGKDLISADYSAIEGRGLAWLAGEEHVLEGYRQGLDPYKVAASGIFKIPYDQVTKQQRQVGKTAELACGYQGAENALIAFGADRLGMSSDEMKETVKGWRGNRPKTVALWKALEKAAFQCVEENGRVVTKYRTIKFRMRGKFLQMVLPSGRALWYYQPRIESKMMPWGEERKVVTAMTVDSKTKRWVRRAYHGGLWTENAVQALCRDILVPGIVACEEAGYSVILHVHDEIVSEVPEDFGSVEEMEELMSQVPDWAEGMPIRAEGWRGKRYRK